MSQNFNEDQMEAFLLYDNIGDNKIDSSQLGDVLRALGLNPTEADIKKYGTEKADIKKYGMKFGKRMSFEEFLPIYNQMQAKSDTKKSTPVDEFVEGFKVFDKDDSGMIASAELRHLLTSLGEKLSEEEVEQLLAGHEDNSGLINYEKFVKTVINQ